MGEYIATTILTGFAVGALFHVIVWVMTRGMVWIDALLEERDI